MKKALIKYFTCIVLLFSASSVFAVPITGKIGFGGGAEIEIVDGEVVTIDFDNPLVNNDASTDGDFSSVAGMSVTFIDPFSVGPADDLWQVGDFSFDLTSITYNIANSNFAFVMGYGIIHGIGYDDTPGSWTFSTNGPGLGSGYFSFSAQTIPEPASLVLLGLGLLGFSGLRRRN